jgi:hypothetical protein
MPWELVKIAMNLTSSIVLFLAILLCACNHSAPEHSAPETVDLFGRNYILSSVDISKPVDISHSEFIGYCSEDEKRSIAQCLGRIRLPGLAVKQISVVWPEERVAARVFVEDNRGSLSILFLAKDRNKEWHVLGSGRVIEN